MTQGYLNDNNEFEDLELTEEELVDLPTIVDSKDVVVAGLDVPAFWGGTEKKWVQSVYKSQSILNTRHGFAASVPIICHGNSCPFVEACYLAPDERVEGARCAVEVATIIDLYNRYCAQLGIDPDNIDPIQHTVDISLINELVELEIKLMRTQKKLAIDADFVQDVVAGVDNHGNAYTRPELHQAEVFAERLRKDIHRIMDILLGTRKAKKLAGMGRDPSSQASNLVAVAQKMIAEGKVDKSMIAIGFEKQKEGEVNIDSD